MRVFSSVCDQLALAAPLQRSEDIGAHPQTIVVQLVERALDRCRSGTRRHLSAL